MAKRSARFNSSTIDSAELDGDTLRIRFKNGSTYEYADVSDAEFDELTSAPSAGQYFASNIRGKKAHERLRDDAPNVRADDLQLDGEQPPYSTDGDLEA